MTGMERARHHRRLASAFALGLLALVAELAGRSLTHRLDFGRHVVSPSYSGAEYYPVLLGVVKLFVALTLAFVVWRALRARKTLSTLGSRLPRLRIELSPRLWLLSFVVTSLIYLVQTDAEQISSGRWPLFAPWLHTSALPIFSVLAVLVALLFGVVRTWLADVARTVAAAVAARLRRLREPHRVRRVPTFALPPRRLHGLAFESRPPPSA